MGEKRAAPPPTIAQYAQRFVEISPIHGCSYVGFRRFAFEAIFWTIVILVSTGFFMNDLVQLCTKYRNEQTAVSVILQRNQTLAFKDAAICFDVFRHHLADSLSSQFKEQTFNQTLANMAWNMSSSAGLFDLSTFSTLDPAIELVMKSIYLLVAAIVDYDLGTPGGGGVGFDPKVTRAVQLVDAFFKQKGYGYDKLSDQVARYMCKQAMFSNCSLTVTGGVDSGCIDLCSTANVNWVGYTMAFAPFDDICFALNTPAMNVFRSSADTFVFETVWVSDMSTLISAWNTSGILNLQGYGAPHLSFEMRGWRGFMDPRDMDSVAFISDGTGFLVGIEIQSQFLAYNHSWGNCGALLQTDCALNCLPATRMAQDGCWPLAGYSLTAAKKPAQVPICNRQYTSNTEINEINSDASFLGNWETCLYKKCTVPPCVSFEYDYEVSFTSYSVNGSINATLYQGKLSYAVFDEYLSMDFNAFLAAVGGSLGLYLGGSLIALAHIPVFIIFSLIARQLRKRELAKMAKIQISEQPPVVKETFEQLPVAAKGPPIVDQPAIRVEQTATREPQAPAAVKQPMMEVKELTAVEQPAPPLMQPSDTVRERAASVKEESRIVQSEAPPAEQAVAADTVAPTTNSKPKKLKRKRKRKAKLPSQSANAGESTGATLERTSDANLSSSSNLAPSPSITISLTPRVNEGSSRKAGYQRIGETKI